MFRAFFFSLLAWTAALPSTVSASAVAYGPVSSTQELFAALLDASIDTILLNDSLVLNGSAWGNSRGVSVNITRSVTLTATTERLAARTYVLLDFSNLQMLFSLASGLMMRFVGLELLNHFDPVGANFRPLRQSVGGHLHFEDCVMHRRVGLPSKAAVVNMLATARPASIEGSQQLCFVAPTFTYTSTRSPTPIVVRESIRVVDFATIVAEDSSMAFQGHQYGGYAYHVVQSFDIADRVVSQACLDLHPGVECVNTLLQQLESPEGTSSSSAHTTMPVIVAATVGSVAAVLAAVGLTVLMVVRRRRARRRCGGRAPGASDGDKHVAANAVVHCGDGGDKDDHHRQHSRCSGDVDVEAPGGAGGSLSPTSSSFAAPSSAAAAPTRAAAAAAAASPAAAVPVTAVAAGGEAGCVFMGLEENQQLPEWSSLVAGEGLPSCRRNSDGAASTSSTSTSSTSSSTSSTPLPLPGHGALLGAVLHDGVPLHGGRHNPATSLGTSSGCSGAGGSGYGWGAGRQDTFGSMDLAVPSAAANDDGTGGGGGGAGGCSGVAAVAVAVAQLSQTQEDWDQHARGLRTHNYPAHNHHGIKEAQLRLEGVLGSGSYGTVYKGTWQGRSVAVKTLVFSAASRDGSRRRALQEATLSASINHPNIVAIYSAEVEALPGGWGSSCAAAAAASQSPISGGAAMATSPPAAGSSRSGKQSESEAGMGAVMDWRLYIIQEYADAGPLGRLYGNKALWPSLGAPDIPAVVGLALGIARALSHLHYKRIIHGDLNPNNVLLKHDPQQPSGYAIKVGDFGLSVMLPEHRSHLSNLRMGTMFYVCPAVVMKAQVGPPSDVFSLGVMLWELFHGRTAGTHTEQGPRYSSIFPAFPPTCPEAYRAVALHCLQRQPQNRPTAVAVVEQLDHLLASYPQALPPPVANPAEACQGTTAPRPPPPGDAACGLTQQGGGGAGSLPSAASGSGGASGGCGAAGADGACKLGAAVAAPATRQQPGVSRALRPAPCCG